MERDISILWNDLRYFHCQEKDCVHMERAQDMLSKKCVRERVWYDHITVKNKILTYKYIYASSEKVEL